MTTTSRNQLKSLTDRAGNDLASARIGAEIITNPDRIP